jgi:hypothetical protein
MADGYVRVYNLSDSEPTNWRKIFSVSVGYYAYAVAYSNDGDYLAIGGYYCIVQILKVSEAYRVQSSLNHKATYDNRFGCVMQPKYLVFHANAPILLTGWIQSGQPKSSLNRIGIFDTRQKSFSYPSREISGPGMGLTINPSSTIAAAGDDKTVSFYDIQDTSNINNWSNIKSITLTNEGYVRTLAFQPGTSKVVVHMYEYIRNQPVTPTITVIDTNSWSWYSVTSTESVYFAFSPSGHILTTAHIFDDSLRFYDARDLSAISSWSLVERAYLQEATQPLYLDDNTLVVGVGKSSKVLDVSNVSLP